MAYNLNGSIILKWIITKPGSVIWMGVMWLRLRSVGRPCYVKTASDCARFYLYSKIIFDYNQCVCHQDTVDAEVLTLAAQAVWRPTSPSYDTALKCRNVWMFLTDRRIRPIEMKAGNHLPLHVSNDLPICTTSKRTYTFLQVHLLHISTGTLAT